MNEERVKWFVRYNFGYRALALLLAVLLWYFVAGQRNPIVDRTFTRPVETRSLSAQMVLASPLPDIKVTVRGFRSLIQSMSEEDIDAYVDLGGREDGVSFIPVKVKVPSGIQLVKVEPDTIRVSLDYLEEKKVPVRVSVTGEPAPGFTTLTPVITPDQVVIKGPSRVLGGIQEAQATLAVNGARDNISQKVRVKVAQETSWPLEIRPGTVDVLLPVVSRGPIKTVSVVADLMGKPKPNFKVKDVHVDPAKIDVTGTPQAIANLSQVLTKPVDISGADGQVIRQTELVLPPDIYPVRDDKVKVTVEIGSAETEQLPNE